MEEMLRLLYYLGYCICSISIRIECNTNFNKDCDLDPKLKEIQYD